MTMAHCDTKISVRMFHMYIICSGVIFVKRKASSAGMGSGLFGVGKRRPVLWLRFASFFCRDITLPSACGAGFAFGSASSGISAFRLAIS